ncbi:MAG: C-GCAxxG-C-C family protein [Acutalibacteraceae bacterium]|jgi:C_GCAxxG_C_C family probable redox protein
MKSRGELAVAKREKGYNCAQAVACTYCDLVGMDEVTLFKLTEALGGGMGNAEGTCGAITGACILAGLVNSSGNLQMPNSKASTAKLSREIMRRFQQRNCAVTCKALKGIETGKMLRSCPDCIRDAAEFAEDILFKEK